VRRPTTVVFVSIAVGVLFLFPLGYLVYGTAFQAEDPWSIITSSTALGPLRRSLLIGVTSAAGAAVVGTALAWLVVRTNVPGRRFWRVAAALPLVIPSFVGAAALRAAFGPGGLVEAIPRPDGFAGAWITLVALSYPYVYLPVAARFAATPPSLEEAARSLGDTRRRALLRVTLPQARGAIAAGTMLVMLYALSDFGAVSLMRYDTLTRAIFSSQLFAPSVAITLGLLLAVVALVVSTGEPVLSGKAVATADTRPPRIHSLGRWRPWAGLSVLAIVSVAFVAPVAVFLVWWLRGPIAGRQELADLVESVTELTGPAAGSTVAGVVAALAAVLVTLPVAYAAVRSHGRVSARVPAVISSVFALPGLVVALAIAFFALRAPDLLFSLYQTFPLLILAYVLHFGAQSMRASTVALGALSSNVTEAAGTLGAGPARRFLTIELPLMAPGLAAGAGLVMLSVLKELPATLLLAPIGFDTLATRIWHAAEDGFLADVGIASLALILLSGILTWLLVLRPAAT